MSGILYKTLGRWALLALALCWLLPSPPAQAHWADLAVAEADVTAREGQVNLTIPTGLVAFADGDRDGSLTVPEIAAARPRLVAFLAGRVQLAVPGQATTLDVAPGAAPPPGMEAGKDPHTSLLLRYAWPQPAAGVSMRYDLFLPGLASARCLASVTMGGNAYSYVFTPEHTRFDPAAGAGRQTFWSFLALGIEHIITGYDHVLFLISLLMLGGGVRYLLQVVTAFTVAHSITLSLAVLDFVALPPRWVESAIALTIVYVAAENFWRKSLAGRWALTFLFGLIHGLGFASILQEMHIPPAQLAASLVSFNIGVEIGQLAIVGSAYLALRALRRYPWELAMRRWVSAGVMAAGLFWFVERAFT